MPVLEVTRNVRDKMEKAISEMYAKDKKLITFDRCLKERKNFRAFEPWPVIVFIKFCF